MTTKLFLAILFPLTLLPWDEPALAAESCEVANYSDLVRCAQRQSPSIRISEQQMKSALKLEDVARQGQNPDLDAETVFSGANRSETSASLLFNIRLGGKKDALINEARSGVERSMAESDLSIAQTRLEIMLSLYRLTHLKNEISVEKESVSTFAKIVNQFQIRPALSPEQEISLSVFKMSLADHQLRLTKLKTDEEKLFDNLVLLSGLPKETISKHLPPVKKSWPAIESVSPGLESPQVRVALADLKFAQSQLQKAEGEAWPDLKIGPLVKSVKEDDETAMFFGVGVSIPIPVLSRNISGRGFSTEKVIESQLIADQAKIKSVSTRQGLVKRYNETIESLKNSLSLSELNQKHQQLEKQFFRGLVPSSLVIEAHRQLFDLEERRNSAELEALEAYGQILILDNKFNEVIL